MSRCDSCKHFYQNAVGNARCGADQMFQDFSCHTGLPANVNPVGCKAYSINELDELRKVVYKRVMFGTSYMQVRDLPDGEFTIPHRRYLDDKDPRFTATVEDQVRTLMVAGVVAADVIAADKYYFEESKK